MSDDTRPANQPTSPPPAAPPPYAPPYAPAYAAAPAPRAGRGGLLLAGLALGIALVAGTAGFTLGHVTADGGRDDHGQMFRQGPDGGPGGQGGPFGQFRMQPPTR
jgi:hypothetical protein